MVIPPTVIAVLAFLSFKCLVAKKMMSRPVISPSLTTSIAFKIFFLRKFFLFFFKFFNPGIIDTMLNSKSIKEKIDKVAKSIKNFNKIKNSTAKLLLNWAIWAGWIFIFFNILSNYEFHANWPKNQCFLSLIWTIFLNFPHWPDVRPPTLHQQFASSVKHTLSTPGHE